MNYALNCANLCLLSYYNNLNYPNSKFINNLETDTQCYIFNCLNEIYIVFRGTDSIKDWKHDIDIRTIKPYNNNIRIHNGFYKQYESIKDNIYNSIYNIKNKKLHILGHSLGGALAYICAVDIFYNFNNPNINVFTIGSPRPGNDIFKDFFNKYIKKSIRYKNKGDIVTKLPLRSEFKHVHKAISINKGKLYKEKINKKIMNRIINLIFTIDLKNMILNHSISEYINNIKLLEII